MEAGVEKHHPGITPTKGGRGGGGRVEGEGGRERGEGGREGEGGVRGGEGGRGR